MSDEVEASADDQGFQKGSYMLFADSGVVDSTAALTLQFTIHARRVLPNAGLVFQSIPHAFSGEIMPDALMRFQTDEAKIAAVNGWSELPAERTRQSYSVLVEANGKCRVSLGALVELEKHGLVIRLPRKPVKFFPVPGVRGETA